MTLRNFLIALGASLHIHTTVGQVAGPVITQNFPDPSLINVDNMWYVFATGSTNNIPYATSPDFDTWTVQTDGSSNPLDAFPTLPSWIDADSPQVWAPDVSLLSDGSYILYYTANTANDTTHHCVGAATSTSITGPYTATDDTNPLFCPEAEGGAIDPSAFVDSASGQRYVIYKVDGNSIGNGGPCGNTVAPIVGTPIMLQPVAADGVTFAGDAATLLNNNGTDDQGIVEAPSLLQTSNGYVLFFSTGCYSTTNYTVSYATSATGINGPYLRQGALFETGTDGLESPGSCDVDADGTNMVFHGTVDNGREMYTAVIDVAGDLGVTF